MARGLIDTEFPSDNNAEQLVTENELAMYGNTLHRTKED